MTHKYRIKKLAAMALAVTSLLATTPTTTAVDADLESIEPRIDRRPFQAMLEAVEVDEDFRVVIEEFYKDYLQNLQTLADESTEKIAAAGKERVDSVMKRGGFLQPDELRRLRVAVVKAEAASWPEAQSLAEGLLLDSESWLPQMAAADFRRAARTIRLAMYLHPRRADELDETYAGDGVDVNVLAEEASRPGGELEGIDERILAGILEEYSAAMEQFLLDTAAAERAGRADAAIAGIEGDRQRQKAALQAALGRWQQLYQLNRSGVEAIGAISFDAFGPESRQRWLERFDHANFPWMFRDTKPVRQHAWIQRMVREPEVKKQADAVLAKFRLEHDRVCGEAIGLMTHSRTVLGAIVHSKSNLLHLDTAVRGIYEKLLRNSGRRAKIEADASSAFEGLVTDGQRKQMRSDFNAGRH